MKWGLASVKFAAPTITNREREILNDRTAQPQSGRNHAGGGIIAAGHPVGVLGKKLGGEMPLLVVVFPYSLFSFVLFLPAARLCSKIVTRVDSPVLPVFWHNTLTMPFTLPTAWLFWEQPSLEQWPWLAALGLIGTVQQLIGAWSIKRADFAVIEPVNFLKLVWAALLGFVFFAELPAVSTILGGVIIIGAVICIAQRGRRAAPAAQGANAGP